MKKILTSCLLFLCTTLFGQSPQLSEEAEVSVITCGPFQGELYSAFGHSGIRVYDPLLRVDNFYNYGVFNFDQPNFYLNFARGNLNYEIGVWPYQLAIQTVYISYNRFVHEQVLNLSQDQKQKVFEYLEWNALPENKTYSYDYFYNNCATKVRDVFADVLKDEIQFDSTFITTDYTIRQLTDLYLIHQPWGDLGIDICLGLPMDKQAAPHDYMFLPDYIESSFNHMTLNGSPIVKETKYVYQSVPESESTSLFHPWVVFGVFLSLTGWLTYRDWRKKKISTWFDIILFSVVGWIGVLLAILWFATDHQAASNNFNIIWAWPLHAFAFILLINPKRSRNASNYFLLAAIKFSLLLIFWSVLPQQLNLFLIPLVVSLLMRSVLIYSLKKKSISV